MYNLIGTCTSLLLLSGGEIHQVAKVTLCFEHLALLSVIMLNTDNLYVLSCLLVC